MVLHYYECSSIDGKHPPFKHCNKINIQDEYVMSSETKQKNLSGPNPLVGLKLDDQLLLSTLHVRLDFFQYKYNCIGCQSLLCNFNSYQRQRYPLK